MKFEIAIERILAIEDVSERRTLADKLYDSVDPLTIQPDDQFLWKLAKDPYYPEVYLEHGKETVREAGFFDDGIPYNKNSVAVADFATILTPRNKINAAFTKNRVIIISTGAFAPMHDGHLEMIEIAKKEMEIRGYSVVGGYVCPDNQDYITRKYNGSVMTAENRILCCEEFVKNSDWISVSRLGMYGFPKDVNFTEIIYRMQKMFPECKIAYVYGSDNAGFSWLFTDNTIGVCVKRNGDGGKYEKYQEMFENCENVIFSNESRIYSDVSSTKIRNRKEKMVYLIRNDSRLVTSVLRRFVSKASLDSANKEFVNKLAKIIEKRVPSNVKVSVVDAVAQRILFDKRLSKKYPTISLDMHYTGDYQIGITRVFELDSNQKTPVKFVSRNTFEPIDSEIAKIPAGEYTLVEDDIASGSTINYIIEKLLSKKIIIKDIALMSKVVDGPLYDIVDVRDFIVGSTQCGLTVRDTTGKIVKVPYCYPYVNLLSRAKLNDSDGASYEIWKANLEYYRDVAPSLTIGDLNNPLCTSLITLVANVEHCHYNKLTEICLWHMNLCKQT